MEGPHCAGLASTRELMCGVGIRSNWTLSLRAGSRVLARHRPSAQVTEGHGRLFREHDTAYWAAIWRTAGPPHQPALSTSVKTPNPTEYQIHRPIFKQSEVHMMIWVRDWGGLSQGIETDILLGERRRS
ncbi:hypothetical protein R3I94_010298 [Phoxinus phoxinus]